MGEVLFRGNRIDNGELVYGNLQYNDIGEVFITKMCTQLNGGYHHRVKSNSISQYVGIVDKFGVKIFEGDKVLIRTLFRDTQVHTGDNIPLGNYEEPMEPKISSIEGFIIKKGCTYYVQSSEFDNLDYLELGWVVIKYDLKMVQDSLYYIYMNAIDNWSDDLDYLLEGYDLEDEDSLVNYLGLEVLN